MDRKGVLMDQSHYNNKLMRMSKFLEPFDYTILSNEDVRAKYGTYKSSFSKDVINDFFNAHKTEAWFREKYHPDYVCQNELNAKESIMKRFRIFNKMHKDGLFTGISLDQNNKQKICDVLQIFDNQFTSSNTESISVLYIPHVSLYLYKSDLVKLFSRESSYLRLKISDPIVCPISTGASRVNEMFGKSNSIFDKRQISNELRRPAWITFCRPITDINRFQKNAVEIDAEIVAEQIFKENRDVITKNSSDDEADGKEEKEKSDNQTASTIPKDLLEKCVKSCQILSHENSRIHIRISRMASSVHLSDSQTIRRHLVMAAKLVFWFDELYGLWKEEQSALTSDDFALPIAWSSHSIIKSANNMNEISKESGSEAEENQEVKPKVQVSNNNNNGQLDELKEELLLLPDIIIPNIWKERDLDPEFDQIAAFRILSEIFSNSKPNLNTSVDSRTSNSGKVPRYFNPLLLGLIENFVDESSSEDDVLSLDMKNSDRARPEKTDKTDKLITILDSLILYLRLVHSVDFYGPSLYADEDNMPRPCGLIHIRPSESKAQQLMKSVSSTDSFKTQKVFLRQILNILRLCTPLLVPERLIRITEDNSAYLDSLPYYQILVDAGHIRPNIEEQNQEINWNGQQLQEHCISTLIKADCLLSRLGLRDPEDAVEQFIKANTKRKKRKVDTIWLCPLSDKKFREPIFVRKHIMNKFMHKVIEAKKEHALFFNNYLLDPWRPQNVTRPRESTPPTKSNIQEKINTRHTERRMSNDERDGQRNVRVDIRNRINQRYNFNQYDRGRGYNQGYRGNYQRNNFYGNRFHDRNDGFHVERRQPGSFRNQRTYNDLDAA